jgi:hypothetical protein
VQLVEETDCALFVLLSQSLVLLTDELVLVDRVLVDDFLFNLNMSFELFCVTFPISKLLQDLNLLVF